MGTVIFSSIYANDSISKYPEAIQKAITYLKTHNFNEMEVGTYEIQGKEMYAMLMELQTSPTESKKPESHKKYIDVQYIVYGKEMQGFTLDVGNAEITDFKEDSDIYFYKSVPNESFVIADPGCYIIYFPNDIHRPGCSTGSQETVRKVVIKIDTGLL